ncbi:5199_t:CDS:2 [Scutellospora calospora]|uniref:5199_t:CDS:1 n=1 Tax=Scutellospora calospora TaxID=85575 RepID=A0ACA9K8N9_9GLOM|nr:5199_t:CDS:2 [Scutellospora calospora]
MCAILIPDDRSPYNKNEDKKKIVTILYLMAGIRNKHVNKFKLELALYLAGSGVTCDAINTLTVHLATCVSKKVEISDPVLIIFNNKSVHNPDNIDASIICEKLINRYQYCFDMSYSQRIAQWNSSSFPNFDRIDQLSIHFYDNAIEERKEEHKMKGQCHLDSNVAPIIADWPGQRYIRQALTHFHNKNDTSIPKEIVSFVPLLGPLHVALNTKEQNMHSRIRATTSPKDTADNIKKQAYLLDFHKYSAFREMFSTTKRYSYTPRDLKFLTTKTSIFLLSQFQEIYKKNEKTVLVSNKIPFSQKRRKKEEIPTTYNLPTLGEIDIKKETVIDHLNRQETLELDLLNKINEIDSW